jgi:hypothetical protein
MEHQLGRRQLDKNDSDDRTFFSPSMLKRRHRLTQAKVRFTVHRIQRRHPFVRALLMTHNRQAAGGVCLDPLLALEVAILRVGIHPDDLAHRLAVDTGEQRRACRCVVDARGRHRPGQKQPDAVSTTKWRLRPSTVLALSQRRSSPLEVVSIDWLSTLAEVRGCLASPACGPCGGAVHRSGPTSHPDAIGRSSARRCS